MTLQQALTDHSGLDVPGLPDCNNMTIEEFWTSLLPLGPLPFQPGRAFWGDGGGMSMAGIALEKATDLTFAAAAQELVLDPAGMVDATYDPDAADREYATGHYGGPVTSVFDCPVLYPIDQLHVSIHDLGALAQWLLDDGQRDILDASAASPYRFWLAHNISGYGLWIDDSNPVGDDPYYWTDRVSSDQQYAFLGFSPKHDGALAMLTNAGAATYEVGMAVRVRFDELYSGGNTMNVHQSVPRDRRANTWACTRTCWPRRRDRSASR